MVIKPSLSEDCKLQKDSYLKLLHEILIVAALGLHNKPKFLYITQTRCLLSLLYTAQL